MKFTVLMQVTQERSLLKEVKQEIFQLIINLMMKRSLRVYKIQEIT